jgi:hypothetical protein
VKFGLAIDHKYAYKSGIYIYKFKNMGTMRVFIVMSEKYNVDKNCTILVKVKLFLCLTN